MLGRDIIGPCRWLRGLAIGCSAKKWTSVVRVKSPGIVDESRIAFDCEVRRLVALGLCVLFVHSRVLKCLYHMIDTRVFTTLEFIIICHIQLHVSHVTVAWPYHSVALDSTPAQAL